MPHQGRQGARRITPLYTPLPKGPHGMPPEEVKRNQRLRIHGAAIEAASRYGYAGTSVKHIIGLAGVSRRAFYELFDGKDDCFARTFDLIARRLVTRVSRSCSVVADRDERMRLAVRVLVEELERHPKALRLIVVEALDGRLTRHQLAGFLSAAEHSVGDGPMAPMIVGGIYRVIFARLHTGRLEKRLDHRLGEWVQLLTAPEAQGVEMDMGEIAAWREPRMPLTAHDYGLRLEEAAINLVLDDSYEALSGLAIADKAGSSLDVFLNLFHDPAECLQAALDRQGQLLLEAVADPALVSHEWPQAAREAIDRLTAHLVANRAYTIAVGSKAQESPLGSVRRMLGIADEVATLLTEGAPKHQVAPELIAGALARTVQHLAMTGRAHELGRLRGHLAYMVLAPYLGGDGTGGI